MGRWICTIRQLNDLEFKYFSAVYLFYTILDGTTLSVLLEIELTPNDVTQ